MYPLTIVIDKIDRTIDETRRLMALANDPLLPALLTELLRYRGLAQSHGPLDSDEKHSVDIGRIGVRELDERYPGYVGLLCDLGAILRDESK